MEDSESAEKQENTGIGPAGACRHRLRTRPTPSRVPDAVQRVTERCTADPGPPQTGTVPGLQRTTSCCAAPGIRERGPFWRNEPNGHFGETNPTCILPIGVVPAKAGTHDHCRWLWVPALAALGRDDSWFSLEHQPAAVQNHCRVGFPVSGLLFTGTFATHTCRAAEGPICYPKRVTPYVTPMCHHASSSHMSPIVVIMCFGFEAPMPTRRIHIRASHPPPGPRPR